MTDRDFTETPFTRQFKADCEKLRKRIVMEEGCETCAELARGSFGPVRYELIDKDGIAITGDFGSASEASEVAKHLWPDQEQDPDRTGAGWDVEIVR